MLDLSQFQPVDFRPRGQGVGIDLGKFMAQLATMPSDPSAQPAPGGDGGAPSAPAAGGAPAAPADDSVGAPVPGLMSEPSPSGPGDVSIGGITAPAPQAAQLPAPKPIAPHESRASRIRDSLFHVVAGGEPEGYDGILTPEEIKKAQPSLLQSLFPAAGEPDAATRWRRNLDALVEHKMLGTQIQRARELQHDRGIVERQLGQAPQDPDGFKSWLRRAYGAYSSIGDLETVKTLNTLLQQVSAGDSKDVGDPYVNIKTGETRYFSKQAGSTVGPDWKKLQTTGGGAGSFKQYIDPQGNVHVLPESQEPPKGWKVVSQFNVDVTQAGSEERHNDSRLTALQKEYGGAQGVGPLVANAITYNKAYQTMDRAMNSKNPDERKALTGAFQSQFTQAGDQGKNLRYQLLQYYASHQDPSLGGTFDIFLTKLGQGTLPRRIQEALLSHIKAIAIENLNQIRSRRRQFLAANVGRLTDKDLPDPALYYTYPGLIDDTTPVGPAAESNDADLMKKYGITPTRKP